MVKKKHVEGHISRGNPCKVKIVESGAESRTCIRIRDSRVPPLEPRVRRRSQRRETSSAMPDTWFWGWTPCSFTWRYLGAGHQVSVASAEVVWRDFCNIVIIISIVVVVFVIVVAVIIIIITGIIIIIIFILSLSLSPIRLLHRSESCKPFHSQVQKVHSPNLSKRRMYKWGSEIW